MSTQCTRCPARSEVPSHLKLQSISGESLTLSQADRPQKPCLAHSVSRRFFSADTRIRRIASNVQDTWGKLKREDIAGFPEEYDDIAKMPPPDPSDFWTNRSIENGGFFNESMSTLNPRPINLESPTISTVIYEPRALRVVISTREPLEDSQPKPKTFAREG